MARPLPTAKQSVDLASGEVRASRIRRDPPPVVKELVIRDRRERDTQTVVIGVLGFVLVLTVIVLGFAYYSGWSPRDVTLVFD